MTDQFKTSFGNTVDLDDICTFSEENKAKAPHELLMDCWHELGYALIYMNYIHNDFPHSDCWGQQKNRVDELIYELKASCRVEGRRKDKMYWLKFKYRILDEIENMC